MGSRDFGRETPPSPQHATAATPPRCSARRHHGRGRERARKLGRRRRRLDHVARADRRLRDAVRRQPPRGAARSPRDYDTYVDRVHETYLAETDTEFNWDHWLDQHRPALQRGGVRRVRADGRHGPPPAARRRRRRRRHGHADRALAKRRSLEYIDTGELNCETPPRAAATAPSVARPAPCARALAVAVGRRVDVARPPPSSRGAHRHDALLHRVPRRAHVGVQRAVRRGAHAPDVCACVADRRDGPSPASRATTSSASRRARRTRPCCTRGREQTTAAGRRRPGRGHAIEHDDAAPASDAAAEMAPQMAVLPPIARDAARTAPGGYPWERLCHESCNATGCHEECDRSADAKPGASLNRSMNFSS